MKKLLLITLTTVAITGIYSSWAQVTPPKEQVFNAADLPSHDLWEGAVRLKAFQGAKTALVLNEIDKGSGAPLHNHPNEQITYVVSGKIRATAGGKEYILGPGELIIIPSYMEHSAEALEDSFTIESFSPIRADWKEWAY
jgi:quercetin dioxygenase-like cupin family protein